MDQSWEQIDSGWDDEPELDAADAQPSVADEVARDQAAQGQATPSPNGRSSAGRSSAGSSSAGSSSNAKSPNVQAEAPRAKRTRARGKQKRRVERATGSARTAGAPPRSRVRAAKPREGSADSQRAARKGMPSWFLPAAVFVAAVGVFVLALVATAD